MKRMIACLLGLALVLTLVCPAFALTKGDELKLAVLGDSISYGTGLNARLVSRYSTLVADHFGVTTWLNAAWDGNECWNVINSITNTKNKSSLEAANCFAISVGSNDYVEYLADYIFEISEPASVPGTEAENDFIIGDKYKDLTDFFQDVLIAPESDMRNGILKFLESEEPIRANWEEDFCGKLQINLETIIKDLQTCNETAPILLLNYYNPGDTYMNFASKASTLLNAANRNINEAIELIQRARSANPVQQMALLPMIQTKLVKLTADIYLFVPLLKEFDLNLTMLSPLLALAGVGFVGVEAFAQDKTILYKLEEIVKLVTALDQLLQFTDDTMVQMNEMLNELAGTYQNVIIIDVSNLGKSAENISPNDHFHPSEQGHQIIANKMIQALETIYAGGAVTPSPTAEEISYLIASIALIRWWTAKVFS